MGVHVWSVVDTFQLNKRATLTERHQGGRYCCSLFCEYAVILQKILHEIVLFTARRES